MFCVPNAGFIFVPAIAADAFMSALTKVPSVILALVITPSFISDANIV